MRIIKRLSGVVLLSYGAWLEVISHGETRLFLAGTVLVLLAFGLLLGWRWTPKT